MHLFEVGAWGRCVFLLLFLVSFTQEIKIKKRKKTRKQGITNLRKQPPHPLRPLPIPSTHTPTNLANPTQIHPLLRIQKPVLAIKTSSIARGARGAVQVACALEDAGVQEVQVWEGRGVGEGAGYCFEGECLRGGGGGGVVEGDVGVVVGEEVEGP